MPIRVEIEGRGTVEFPDGTPHAVIDSTIQRDFFSKNETTWKNRLWQAVEPYAGMAEGAASAITGLAAMPIAGLGGLAKTITSGGDAGTKAIEDISAGLTYQPKTESGRSFAEMLGTLALPFQMAGQGWGALSELATTQDLEKASQVAKGESPGSNIATPTARVLGEIAAMAASGRPLEAAKGYIKGGVGRPTTFTPEQIREAFNRLKAGEMELSPEDVALNRERIAGWDKTNEILNRQAVRGKVELNAQPEEPPIQATSKLYADTMGGKAQAVQGIIETLQKQGMPNERISEILAKIYPEKAVDFIEGAKNIETNLPTPKDIEASRTSQTLPEGQKAWDVILPTAEQIKGYGSVVTKPLETMTLQEIIDNWNIRRNLEKAEQRVKNKYGPSANEELINNLKQEYLKRTGRNIETEPIQNTEGLIRNAYGQLTKVSGKEEMPAGIPKVGQAIGEEGLPTSGGVTMYGGIPGIQQLIDAGKWLAGTRPVRKIMSFFQPDLAIPEGKEFMYSRQEYKGMIALGEAFAESFANKYKYLKPNERQTLWDFLNGSKTIDQLPAELKTPANDLRMLDNTLGKMLVDQGLMSPETFEANKGNHIRYIYNIYEQGGDLFGSGWQKLNKGFLKERKDLTDLEREKLGLVKDPIQAITRSIVDTYQAVGASRHFENIANNPNWVFQPAQVKIDGKTIGLGRAQRILDAYANVEKNGHTLNAEQIAYRDKLQQAIKDANAVNVPKDYIQLNGSQYGALDGQFVRKEIAQDIKPFFEAFQSSSEALNKTLAGIAAANGIWKIKNVAVNVPTAARNTISNPVQLLMSGMRPDRVITRTIESIGELYKKGKYYDEALRQGVFQGNFSTGELAEIMKIASGFNANNWVDFMSRVQHLTKYYGRIDDMFKLAKFIDMREAGATPKEAAYQANKWGMDYSFAHPYVKLLRNAPLGMPFVSYQYKIAPLIAESLAKRPWVIGSIFSLPYLLQKAITKDMTDEDAKRYIESLPSYVKNKQVFLIPGTHGMNALDVSYMVPWGNWYQVANSMGEGKISKAFKQLGVASGLIPSILYGVTTGKDLFTGEPIVSDLEKYDPKMTAWAITKWIWQQAAPPMLTETSVAGKVAEHLKHGQTSKGLPTEAMNVYPRIVGVNIYPVDPRGKQKEQIYEIKNVRKALMKKMFDRNISPDERRAAYDAYRMAVSYE